MWGDLRHRTPTACSACSAQPQPSYLNDYASAVAAVAFCGFVALIICAARRRNPGLEIWLASVVLVFGILIVPR